MCSMESQAVSVSIHCCPGLAAGVEQQKASNNGRAGRSTVETIIFIFVSTPGPSQILLQCMETDFHAMQWPFSVVAS
jgi:hypothetical protein